EVELHLIRSRLTGGLWEAARRGELRTQLPVGFEYDRSGAIVLTPDEAVRETVALVFTKFAELGSARQVVVHLRERGLPLPHRERLRGNWRAPKGEAGGAVREGAALLQGLLRCGRCGRRMQVTYSGTNGRVRRYACHQAHRMQAADRTCQSLGGVRLDRRVAD